MKLEFDCCYLCSLCTCRIPSNLSSRTTLSDCRLKSPIAEIRKKNHFIHPPNNFYPIFYLIFPRHRFNSRNFPPLRVFPSCWSYVNHSEILQLVRAIKYASSIVSAHHSVFAILKRRRKYKSFSIIIPREWQLSLGSKIHDNNRTPSLCTIFILTVDFVIVMMAKVILIFSLGRISIPRESELSNWSMKRLLIVGLYIWHKNGIIVSNLYVNVLLTVARSFCVEFVMVK